MSGEIPHPEHGLQGLAWSSSSSPLSLIACYVLTLCPQTYVPVMLSFLFLPHLLKIPYSLVLLGCSHLLPLDETLLFLFFLLKAPLIL